MKAVITSNQEKWRNCFSNVGVLPYRSETSNASLHRNVTKHTRPTMYNSIITDQVDPRILLVSIMLQIKSTALFSTLATVSYKIGTCLGQIYWASEVRTNDSAGIELKLSYEKRRVHP